MHARSSQYVSLRWNVYDNGKTANTVCATAQMKFNNNEIQGSVIHFLGKSMLQALSISFTEPGCRYLPFFTF